MSIPDPTVLVTSITSIVLAIIAYFAGKRRGKKIGEEKKEGEE